MAYYAGKDGSATIAGVTQKCRKWEVTEEAGEHEVTNMDSPTGAGGEKYGEYVGGIVRPRLTMDLAYNDTVARATMGTTVAFTCLFGSGHGFSGSGVMRNRRNFTDIDGAAMVNVEMRVTGALAYA